MSNISLSFAFDSNAIRVVGTPEEPKFVGSDVTKILGFTHSPHAYRLLDEDEKGVHKVDTPGGEQELTVITESGLYSLILRSNKPEAKLFKRWVTHEVLPSIRKTGEYRTSELRKQLQQVEGMRQSDAQQIVDLYRNNIFGELRSRFYDAQRMWRLWYLEESYAKVGRLLGCSGSKVSTWSQRYQHYLDATRMERYRLPDNMDDISLSKLVPIYGSVGNLRRALIDNDRYLHAPYNLDARRTKIDGVWRFSMNRQQINQ